MNNIPKLAFEQIYRHALDNEIKGRHIDPFAMCIAREKVENAMLDIIERYGLTNVLLVDLELYELNKAHRRSSGNGKTA